MLTWEIVNRFASDLATSQARSNWRQRGEVPHRHRFIIRSRADAAGVYFGYDEFNKLKPIKPRRKKRNGK